MLSELSNTIQTSLSHITKKDCIRECGESVLHVLDNSPDAAVSLAHEKLHAWPYKDVPVCWRRLYEEASVWKAKAIVDEQTVHLRKTPALELQQGQKRNRDGKPILKAELAVACDVGLGGLNDWLSAVVHTLDMALILTGGPARKALIFHILETLGNLTKPDKVTSRIPASFPKIPTVQSQVDTFVRSERLDFVEFQAHLDFAATPLIIEGVLEPWSAIRNPERQWSNPRYLTERTLGGRRLVPVELGRSYTEEGWGQQIMTFAEYMDKYLLDAQPVQTGYLAQHDLLDQIPLLDADTVTPDYCFTTPPPAVGSHIVPQPPLDEPLRNAWLGPAGTISPLHTDPYHNILCQVVGHKYVRLYAPSETPKLYPRGMDESGVSMENTSEVDISLARKLFNPSASVKAAGQNDSLSISVEEEGGDQEKSDANQRHTFERHFPLYKDAKFIEGVLGPGECLYIPVGWWHYIESLSTSFSVSYWFN